MTSRHPYWLLALWAAGSVLAQTSPDSSSLEEIVVTAQRRQESAQTVPIALSVLSGEELAARGIESINQLQYVTPSLEVEPQFGSGQPGFRLRGVGFTDYVSNNTPTVGTYVDEVAYPLPIMTQGLLFDLDRVEVLRGPQGTLYGRNTTGGAINFVTKKPTQDFNAGVSAEYGRYDLFKAEGYVSGPLTDALRARFSASTLQGGAWQHNRSTGQDLGDHNDTGVRAQLEWLPTDGVNVLLGLHGARDKSDGLGLSLFAPFPTAPFPAGPGPALPADSKRSSTDWDLRPAFAETIGIDPDSKPFRNNKTGGADLNAHVDFADLAFTSISSFNKLRRREYNDWDATELSYADVYFDSDARVLSQEFRLGSKNLSAFNWVTGLYYSREKLDEQWFSDLQNAFGFATKNSYEQLAKTYGVFGQTEFQLADQLTLVTGVRYEHEKRELNHFDTTTDTGGPLFIAPADRQITMSQVSGKIGFNYQLRAQTLLYVSASRGVKSGGFTAYNTQSVDQLAPFRPEILYAYEFGAKSDLARNIRLNGAVFYYDYRDQQVQSAIYAPPFGPIGKIVNADKSRIYGAELELQWDPVANFSVNQSVGYKKGEFRKFTDLDTPASVAANQAVFVDKRGQDLIFPRFNYQGVANYRWIDGAFRFDSQIDFSYRDRLKSFFGDQYTIGGYGLLGARFALAPSSGKSWEVAFFGRNLANKRYDLTRNFFLPGIDVAAAGLPRTYGVQASYTF